MMLITYYQSPSKMNTCGKFPHKPQPARGKVGHLPFPPEAVQRCGCVVSLIGSSSDHTRGLRKGKKVDRTLSY